MIYFLRRADGAIKIGTTEDYYSRLLNLEREHGSLTLLGWIDGGKTKERTLHQRFAPNRIVKEWFNPSNELLAFITANTKSNRPTPMATLEISHRTKALISLVAMTAFEDERTPDEIIWGALVERFPDAVENVLQAARKLGEQVFGETSA